MLAEQNRLKRSVDFKQARAGARAARPSVVVHCVDKRERASQPVLIGFVVSKAVGNAVTRNRVKRRMRAVMMDWLTSTDQVLTGKLIVVRALPALASAPFDHLHTDVIGAVTTAVRRCNAQAGQGQAVKQAQAVKPRVAAGQAEVVHV